LDLKNSNSFPRYCQEVDVSKENKKKRKREGKKLVFCVAIISVSLNKEPFDI